MAGGRTKGRSRGKKRPRPSPKYGGSGAKQQQLQHEALLGEASVVSSSYVQKRDDPASTTITAVKDNEDDGDDARPRSNNCWRLFLALCLFRILNTFLIRSYFDPDEFWQTLEPAYCHVFGNCQGLTWEWTRRYKKSLDEANNGIAAVTSALIECSLAGPVRTYLSVLPTHVLYRLLKTFQLDSEFLVSRGPMILSAVTVAAPIDLAVWYTAAYLQRPSKGAPAASNTVMMLPAWCLFCSLSSWFNGYTLVRTFSNCQEALFLMLALTLVSPELLLGKNGHYQHRYEFLRSCLAFLLGGLSAAIRFTSVAAFVPMGILLALRKSTVRARLIYLFVPCALFGLIGIAMAMVVDRVIFGFWTIPLLANFHFNVVLNLADLYGSHPFHWYLTAGLPAVTGTLLPFVYFDLWRFVRGDDIGYGQRNLWIIVLSYLLTMSMSAHKEFRFILPVLPLLCVLTGQHVRSVFVGGGKKPNQSRMFWIGSMWIVANFVTILYLGLLHQSGPISANRAIVAIAKGSGSNEDSFSVHYLTGSCHSTPLHSHLHSPPLQFDTWHLDCSPECRSDSNLACESDQFAQDPVGFIKSSYCSRLKRLQRKKCVLPPDFVVTFSEYAPQIQSQLESFGLRVVARFPHSINGIGVNVNSDIFGSIKMPGSLELSVDEVVLFSKYRLIK